MLKILLLLIVPLMMLATGCNRLNSAQATGSAADNAVPYSSGKRADTSALADLEHGAYAPGQSTQAMRGLLGSPHSVSPGANGSGTDWYLDPQVPNRLVGFDYDSQGRWTGQIQRANNAPTQSYPGGL